MDFLEGYLVGLGMIVFIGPVFFLLLSVSLQLGGTAGSLAAFGIFVSDIVCVCLCYYGVTSFLNDPTTKNWIVLSGGLLLILLGSKYMFKKDFKIEEKKDIASLRYISCFVKGFLVNFVNPFVFFVWIGVITYEKTLEANGCNPLIYLSGTLLAILTTDLSKVFLAKWIRKFLNPRKLGYFYKASGIFLIGFGIRLLLLFN
ncbi:MAG TPA: LysE family transporter [Leptospiraceae bacterium]|nr:LysE family transporter [Leptospiraceae bacterium]HMW07967.1 LysE family transporter [Leptospiraceae bacterium]HMX35112.1 LysE family transporter [Leptospiraceae bacterium]HMY34067.1 LysE family transporter [Leptospiraceae bacterium]HMZ67668.1 LysE family transporter [Leptospiraceae bacterium]